MNNYRGENKMYTINDEYVGFIIGDQNKKIEEIPHYPNFLSEYKFASEEEKRNIYSFLVAYKIEGDRRIHRAYGSTKDFYVTRSNNPKYDVKDVDLLIHLDGPASYAHSIYDSERKLIDTNQLHYVLSELGLYGASIRQHTEVEFHENVLWIWEEVYDCIMFFKFNPSEARNRVQKFIVRPSFAPRLNQFKKAVEKALTDYGDSSSNAKYNLCEAFYHDRPEFDPKTSVVKLHPIGKGYYFTIEPMASN